MPANLKRRHDTWYAVYNVPRAHRAAVGRSELLATLRTSKLAEANARKLDALRALQARVEAIMDGSPERLATAEALSFRASLRAPASERPNLTDENEEVVFDAVREQADTYSPALKRRILEVATGNAVFLKEVLPTFIKEQDHIRKKTAHEYNSSCRDFLKWHGEDTTEQEVTRKRAGAYIGHLKGLGLARATVQRKVSALSALWTWMMKRGHIEEDNPALNPWLGHGVAKKSKFADEDPRRLWNDAELTLILQADWPALTDLGAAIRDLIRLALLSGVRQDEICEWKADMVERDDLGVWINNRKGKTRAARRRFPLHPAAIPIVERLMANPDKEGYLLHDLPRGGYDKTRAFYVSKHFGRVIRKLGITDPKVVFHTLRNTFSSFMEKAHAPPNAVKLMVAHERRDMTYGTYSKGDLVELQEVIRLLRYSDPIMALIAA